MRANSALKQKDTVGEYKISKQAVSDILKQEKTWLIIETETPSAKQMRNRKPAFIEVDDAMNKRGRQISTSFLHSSLKLNLLLSFMP